MLYGTENVHKYLTARQRNSFLYIESRAQFRKTAKKSSQKYYEVKIIIQIFC